MALWLRSDLLDFPFVLIGFKTAILMVVQPIYFSSEKAVGIDVVAMFELVVALDDVVVKFSQ